MTLSRMSLLCATTVTAFADVQTQHIMDSSVGIGAFEPLWHFRVRTTPQGGGVAQIRFGPILNFDLNERVTLIAGYYFTRTKENLSWRTTHRSFGDVEGVVWKRVAEVDVRSLMERYTVISGPDYSRFRNRIRLSPLGATAPYVGFEVFIDGAGLRSMRYSAGIRRNISSKLSADLGYFYEDGWSGTVRDRHMIGTTIHWRDQSTRIDTDP